MTRTETARRFDGRTFVWDGREYETETEAEAAETEYLEKGFEVRRLSQEGRTWLYTRRTIATPSGA